MKTIVTMTEQGQVALPLALLRKDRIRACQQFEIERLKAGQYLLKKLPKKIPVKGKGGTFVDLLLACPEKGWFQPIESESTDTIINVFEDSGDDS